MLCRSCGSQVPDDARFCGVCGSPIQPGEEDLPGTDQGVADVTSGATTTGDGTTEIRPASVDVSSDQPTLKVARESTPVPPPAAFPPAAATRVPPPPPHAPSGSGTAGPTGYGPTGYGQPGYGPSGYGPPGYGPPGMPPRKSRRDLWIGVAVAAVIVIAAAITVPLLLLDKDDDTVSTGTTRSSTTTTTTTPSSSSTSTSASSTSTTTSTTTTPTTAPPGDSAGEWFFADAPQIPEYTFNVKVSDEVLLMEANTGSGYALYARFLESGDLIRLPTGGTATLDADLDGSLAVWREAEYDWDTDQYSNPRLYTYKLPDGPKVEVARGVGTYSLPQIAGSWVTWVEGAPWDADPEIYTLKHIYGIQISPDGEPLGDPIELVSAATVETWDESYWTYSLSSTHLAWEVGTPVDIFDAGTYVMDLESRQPLRVDEDSWLPSLGGQRLVYWSWEEGLKVSDLKTGGRELIDYMGDYATAGPTFVAYYRSVETPDSWTYELVARGYESGYEQVLLETETDPYYMVPIAVSDKYVAVLIDDVMRLYTWQGE